MAPAFFFGLSAVQPRLQLPLDPCAPPPGADLLGREGVGPDADSLALGLDMKLAVGRDDIAAPRRDRGHLDLGAFQIGDVQVVCGLPAGALQQVLETADIDELAAVQGALQGRFKRRGQVLPRDLGAVGDRAFAPAIGVPCLLYTSPSPRDQRGSRMPSSA